MTKKADYIWFNGEMVPRAEAKVHVMSHALHYGTSVFEGVRCYDSHLGPVVFRHREHMQRLHDSAKIYRMPVSQSVDELMEACRATLRKNNPSARTSARWCSSAMSAWASTRRPVTKRT